ncbi:MAG TPA: DUF1266 domain-containing protein [Planktothrix sp.]|jgi:tetratricopeptide (TPR) repeat protein
MSAGHHTFKQTLFSAVLLFAISTAPGIAVPDGLQIRPGFAELPSRKEDTKTLSLEELNRAIKNDPKKAKLYYQRAWCFSHQDKREDAIRDLSVCLSLDAKNAEAWLLRSEMYNMLAQYAKALADADKAISLYPEWSYALGERARLFCFRERYQQATADAQKALSVDRRDCRTMAELAAACDALGLHQKALDVATLSIKTRQEDDPKQLNFSLHDRGLVYMHLGQFADAERDLDAALDKNGDDSTALYFEAINYAMQNRLEEARNCSDKALSMETFAPRGCRLKAEMLRAAGKWKESLDYYNRSTSMEPNYAPGQMQRAQAHLALGNLTEAQSAVAASLSANPDSAMAHSYLGLIEELQGDQTSAQQEFDKAFALTPDLAINNVNHARVLYHRGKWEEALKDCDAAIAQDAYLPDAYDIRSLILMKLGNSVESDRNAEIARKLGWHKWDYAIPSPETSNQPVAASAAALFAPKSLSPKPVQFAPAEISEKKRWVFAAGAVWTDDMFIDSRIARGANSDCLTVFARNPYNIDYVKQILARLHITDRASLFKVVSEILEKGARQEFNEMGKRVTAMSQTELQRFKQDPLNMADLERTDVVLQHYKRLGAKSIIAFDYVRAIDIYRLGACCGLLTDQETWDRILPIAIKLQKGFNSWNDIADDFVVGRAFFYSGPVNGEKVFDETLNILKNDPSSPWKEIPWQLAGL